MAQTNKRRLKRQLVAADIIHRIQSKEWRVGTKIPSIDELVPMYPYSRMTIFKAVDQLVTDGYLEVRRGVGTFVISDRVAGLIALVIGEEVLHPQQTPFAFLLSQHLQHFYERLGFRVKLYIEAKGPVSEAIIPADFKTDLAAGRLSGLLTVSCDTGLVLDECTIWNQHPIPHVDMTAHSLDVPQVLFDLSHAVDIFLLYARQIHCKKIGVIMGSEGLLERLREGCTAFDMETRPEWQCWRPHYDSLYEKSGYELMRELLSVDEQPDIILVADDIGCKGAVQACLKRGLDIPGDVRLVTVANRGSDIFYPVDMPQIEFE